MFLWSVQSKSIQDCRLDVVKFLLEHGADPDAKSNRYGTPLHYASRFGSVKGAQLMLENGANIHVRNKEGPIHRYIKYWSRCMTATIPWICF